MRLFVIPGHGAGDSGAVGNGYSECDLARSLATRLRMHGGSDVILADFARDYYADNGISKLDLPVDDTQIIELHLDSSSNPSARGGHVIIKEGYLPDDYDRALANFISGFAPGRAEPIVRRGDLANPRRAARRGYAYRLLECCFITNALDVEAFTTHIDDLARGILSCFGIGAQPETSEPDLPEPDLPEPDPPEPEPHDPAGTYRCVVDAVNVRVSPSVTARIVASYRRGGTVVLDSWRCVADGYVWGRYAAWSGNTRYVAVEVVMTGKKYFKKV